MVHLIQLNKVLNYSIIFNKNIFVLVHESVIKNKIPVVLLEGTGGCCDLFAKCYQLYNEYHSKLKSSEEAKFVFSYYSFSHLFFFIVKIHR
jgi:hypothetical protein